jgi:ArsR family transcriptional regulator
MVAMWANPKAFRLCFDEKTCPPGQERHLAMQNTLRRFKADIFQALAHPTRIAIVEMLREGEVSAGTILERLGVEQANASQHLAVLRAKQIVVNRKEGNQVFYSLRSHRLTEVLDLIRLYFEEHLSEATEMLTEIRLQTPPPTISSGEKK